MRWTFLKVINSSERKLLKLFYSPPQKKIRCKFKANKNIICKHSSFIYWSSFLYCFKTIFNNFDYYTKMCFFFFFNKGIYFVEFWYLYIFFRTIIKLKTFRLFFDISQLYLALQYSWWFLKFTYFFCSTFLFFLSPTKFTVHTLAISNY